MTTATAHGHSSIERSQTARESGFLAGIIEGWRRHLAFREHLRDLSSLSQRELDERGIDRRMITRLALEMAEKKDK